MAEATMAGAAEAIACQGAHGAYSAMACRAACPERPTLPCAPFEDTCMAVHEGKTELAIIPIENSSAGRVADIHHLLPDSGLHIIGEHFQKVEHQLLAVPGTRLEDLEQVHSHVQALSQCGNFLRSRGLLPVVHPDTAGAAHEVAERGEKSHGAIASALAAQLYGLETLLPNVHDQPHNTTRFVIMAREPAEVNPDDGPVVTSLVFRVRSVPAALYKAMGGFATNGVNITKLESYMIDDRFTVTQFYADIEGHPEQRLVRLALEELGFFSREVKILGVYPAAPFRQSKTAR